jgi:predicted dehydrogenase
MTKEKTPQATTTRRAFLANAAGASVAGSMLGAAALGSQALGAEQITRVPEGGDKAGATLDIALPGPPPEQLPAGKKLRIAVVGGGFGRSFPWHLHSHCKVEAVSELRTDRRDLLKQTFKCDNTYGDFHDLLSNKNIDAVAIYTEAVNHAQHCIDVMKAGKKVMTVIPTAVTLEDCQRVIDVQRQTGMTYMYGETSCHSPHALMMRELFKQGRFGTVFHADCRYVHDIYTDMAFGMKEWFIRDGKKTWRYGYPQGFYVGHGTGPAIATTRDRYVEVASIGMRKDQQMWRDNAYGNPFANSVFFFKTAKGATSQMQSFWECSEPSNDGCDLYGTTLSMHANRHGLTARVGRHDKIFPVDISAYLERLPPGLRNMKGGHDGAEPQIVHEFVAACLNERKPAIDALLGAAITAPGLVGFQSALKGGEWMKVPDFGSIA